MLESRLRLWLWAAPLHIWIRKKLDRSWPLVRIADTNGRGNSGRRRRSRSDDGFRRPLMVAQNQTNPTFYAVTYFEVLPTIAGRSAAAAALKAYGTAVRAQDGFGSIESFEQIGRP